MRVLLLLDNLTLPEARVDLEMLLAELPRQRLQPYVCFLRAPASALKEVLPGISEAEPVTALGAERRLSFPAARRLLRLVREQDIELVHALEPGAILYASLMRRLADIPTLANCYHMAPLPGHDGWRWRARQLRWRLVLWGIDRVVAPSDLVRRHIYQVVNFDRNRIDVIYPGVRWSEDGPSPDREMLGLPPGPLVTMFVPAQEEPGYELAIDALPKLKHRVGEVHLAIAGAGPYTTELQRKAANIRPALPIRWLGMRQDAMQIIAASDVIIATPTHETVPASLMQAAVIGKPVVATRVGGITELVEPGMSGLLITPNDTNDLALQISRFLLQPAFSERTGKAAKRRARERFTLEWQVEAMTTLYEATIYASR